ncbi:MAG: hypothetical protein ABSD43_10080 [Terracidiphilus sp.]
MAQFLLTARLPAGNPAVRTGAADAIPAVLSALAGEPWPAKPAPERPAANPLYLY